MDILIVAETKLDSFPKDQFLIPGYKRPERLDLSDTSGGLLAYITEGIIPNTLRGLDPGQQKQILPNEINIRKQKWLLLPVYRPRTQNRTFSMDNIAKVLDKYSADIENALIIGDYSCYSLQKGPACFKSANGRCIDLMLTNKKHLFFHS